MFVTEAKSQEVCKKELLFKRACINQELKDTIYRHVKNLEKNMVLLAETNVMQDKQILLLTDNDYGKKYISKYFLSKGNDTILSIRSDDIDGLRISEDYFDRYDRIKSYLILIPKDLHSNIIKPCKKNDIISLQVLDKNGECAIVGYVSEFPVFYFIKRRGKYCYLGWGT